MDNVADHLEAALNACHRLLPETDEESELPRGFLEQAIQLYSRGRKELAAFRTGSSHSIMSPGRTEIIPPRPLPEPDTPRQSSGLQVARPIRPELVSGNRRMTTSGIPGRSDSPFIPQSASGGIHAHYVPAACDLSRTSIDRLRGRGDVSRPERIRDIASLEARREQLQAAWLEQEGLAMS